MESLWKALLSGQSGAKLCHTFDMSGFTCPFVAQLAADQLDIKQFVPKSYRKATKVMARDIELAVAAAILAATVVVRSRLLPHLGLEAAIVATAGLAAYAGLAL